MTAAFIEANTALRDAVAARMAATPADDPKMQGYSSKQIKDASDFVAARDEFEQWRSTSCCDGQRLRGDSLLADDVHPVSQRYFDLLDTLRELHISKSADYGSEHDPLANIRNGAEFVGIEPWRAAMVRLSDKVTRLATFNRTGKLRHESVVDSLLDLASYSLLSLLLYQEDQA